MVAMALRSAPTFRYRTITSIAEAVVRQAGVPILLVRGVEAAQPPRAAPLRTILVALDGTPIAEQALEAARAIAKAAQASLLLVAALPPAGGSASDSGALEPVEDARQMSTYLERLAAEVRDSGVAVGTRLQTGGDPAGVIVELAGAQQADLIVMATHGSSGHQRFRLGSVARGVGRRARQPLLLIGPHNDQ
jgi:nucleotide-binding universal stress UspA family protein